VTICHVTRERAVVHVNLNGAAGLELVVIGETLVPIGTQAREPSTGYLWVKTGHEHWTRITPVLDHTHREGPYR
jgi:hypothetical protein